MNNNTVIKNNFSRLVGERLIKLNQISEATGISRTTLTSIYNRRCKAITFDVLDKLCKYLQCEITDIIEYVPTNSKEAGDKVNI